MSAAAPVHIILELRGGDALWQAIADLAAALRPQTAERLDLAGLRRELVDVRNLLSRIGWNQAAAQDRLPAAAPPGAAAVPAVPGADAAAPIWTEARKARGAELWAQHVGNDAILAELNALPGWPIATDQAISKAASRFGWRRQVRDSWCTEARRAVLERDWPTGRPLADIVAEFAALPGPGFNPSYVATWAARLGLRRPDGFRKEHACRQFRAPQQDGEVPIPGPDADAAAPGEAATAVEAAGISEAGTAPDGTLPATESAPDRSVMPDAAAGLDTALPMYSAERLDLARRITGDAATMADIYDALCALPGPTPATVTSMRVGLCKRGIRRSRESQPAPAPAAESPAPAPPECPAAVPDHGVVPPPARPASAVRRSAVPPELAERDGSYSPARQQLRDDQADVGSVAITLAEAALWGARNGVTVAKGERAADLMPRINARRREFGLPVYHLVKPRTPFGALPKLDVGANYGGAAG